METVAGGSGDGDACGRAGGVAGGVAGSCGVTSGRTINVNTSASKCKWRTCRGSLRECVLGKSSTFNQKRRWVATRASPDTSAANPSVNQELVFAPPALVCAAP